jgi:DNA-binding protein HU-beta
MREALCDAGFLDTRHSGRVKGRPLRVPAGERAVRQGRTEEVLRMTKAQLVTKLADSTGLSRKQGDSLIDCLVDTVVKEVKKGNSVKIPGLGIFRLRKMKARMGRNPQTGEPIKIPARKKVGFSVAKTFKETVLGKSK